MVEETAQISEVLVRLSTTQPTQAINTPTIAAGVTEAPRSPMIKRLVPAKEYDLGKQLPLLDVRLIPLSNGKYCSGLKEGRREGGKEGRNEIESQEAPLFGLAGVKSLFSL